MSIRKNAGLPASSIWEPLSENPRLSVPHRRLPEYRWTRANNGFIDFEIRSDYLYAQENLHHPSIDDPLMMKPSLIHGLLAVLLSGFYAAQASASPYYVRSIATAQASGNILTPSSYNNDTGEVQTTSISAGPGLAQSTGSLYSFNASTNAFAEIGSLHGSVMVQASSSGPAGGGSANSQTFWSDSLTITSPTLPNGAPVSFLATIFLHRTITGNGNSSAFASVTGPFGLNLTDMRSAPNPVQSVSTIVNTTVGSVLSATSSLNLHADAGGLAPFSMSVSVLAENTAVFQFEPITPGASYLTASGVRFVPEPTTGVMVLGGIVTVCLRSIGRIRANKGNRDSAG